MTQQQKQSSFSQGQVQRPSQADSPDQSVISDASLSPPAKPDPTSPYEGPADHAMQQDKPVEVAGHGPEEMEQPYFSEAQSTLGAFAPVERSGDGFAQPEDPQTEWPAEQPSSTTPHAGDGAEYPTDSGIVRSGMTVVDSYGHAIGIVEAIEGERMRLASTDPHDGGVAFLPVGLIDGIDADRVLLGGRGDASFGIAAD